MNVMRLQYFQPREATVVSGALADMGLPVSKLSATPDHRIWQATMPTVRDADVLVDVLLSSDDDIEVIAWHVNRGELQVTFGFTGTNNG